jgi:hypothetical protein
MPHTLLHRELPTQSSCEPSKPLLDNKTLNLRQQRLGLSAHLELASAYVSIRMLTYADVCWRMLTYALSAHLELLPHLAALVSTITSAAAATTTTASLYNNPPAGLCCWCLLRQYCRCDNIVNNGAQYFIGSQYTADATFPRKTLHFRYCWCYVFLDDCIY